MHWTTFTNYLVSLFAITNPFGNMAIFLSLTADRKPSAQRKIAINTAIAITITLTLMCWGGIYVLKIFGIQLSAFEAAGGVIIAVIGFHMLTAKHSRLKSSIKEHEAATEKENISIVPLTIPLIAGPGAMTAVIVAAKHNPTIIDLMSLTGGIVIIALVAGTVLFFSNNISKILGIAGVRILSRIMGLILLAIAIGMLANGMRELFPVLAR